MSKPFKLIDNYIYFYHLDEYCIIPQYPESIGDSNTATFATTPILGRSAPIATYSYSGPRTVDFKFMLHRDMMNDISLVSTTMKISEDEDVVDALVRRMHSAVLPKYTNITKAVNPPILAVRIGNDIYIKGVVNGSVSVNKSGPIINGKYAVIEISFNMIELDPYDAETSKLVGSYRGLDATVLNKISGGR